MIPGNRPEDTADEEFFAAIENRIAKENPKIDDVLTRAFEDDDIAEAIMAYAAVARDLAYTNGYNDGRWEAAVEQAAEHL